MSLKSTKPLSGFVELLPAAQRCFDLCASKMLSILENAGFSKLDLPAIERAEVLTDKDNWDEIETQMFLFQKGDTKMGLRYDGTVGLSRYVARYVNNLVFPFKATQFSKRYRGERAQRGRYREFYQMDLDIMGINTLSINYDAEIIATIQQALNSCTNYIGENQVSIGSRPFWDAFFAYLNLTNEQKKNTFILIDKKDKLSEEVFNGELTEILKDKEKEDKIKSVFFTDFRDFLGINKELDQAITSLLDFMEILNIMGVKDSKIDLSITRGLAYYTGLVFEFKLKNYPELGTVAGGGRYENLTSKFSKTKIIGVGAAIGFSRIFTTLLENNQLDLSNFIRSTDLVILTMGKQNLRYTTKLLQYFKNKKIKASMYLDIDKKLKTQLEYVNKIKAKYCVIIGDNEITTNTMQIKDMELGIQKVKQIDWKTILES